MTFIRRIFFSNFFTKLLALFLGLLMYFYVLSEQNPIIEKGFVLDPKIESLEKGIVVLTNPAPVTLKLQGPRQILSTLDPSEIVVYLDAAGKREGRHSLPVHIKTLPEIEVLSYSPQKVTLKFDRYIQQKFAIETNKIGRLPENFTIEREEVKPEACVVVGAKSRLGKVRHVLATFDITNTTSALKKEVQLRPIDEEGKDISDIFVRPVTAEVYLKVSLLFQKEVSVVAYLAGQPAPPFRLKGSIAVSPQRIIISGAKEEVKKISIIKTAPIDLSAAQTNQTFQIPLLLPKNIQSDVHEVNASAEIVKEEPAPPHP